MQASPSFSKRSGPGKVGAWAAACALCVLLSAAGCVTVEPQDKEFLAEPAMTWGGEGLAERGEQHVLDNREGSVGGGSTSGGGCGCN